MNVAAVPLPLRSDVGDLGRLRAQGPIGDSENAPAILVTPTQPHEAEIKRLFRIFLDFYDCNDERKDILVSLEDARGADEPVGFYRRSLELICKGGSRAHKAIQNLDAKSLTVNREVRGLIAFPIKLTDVVAASPPLQKWILEFPADCLVYLDEELRVVVEQEITPKLASPPPFAGVRATLYDHPHVCALRDIDPTKSERLVSIEGTVIRISRVIPEMQIAVFRCTAIASRNFEQALCDNEVSELVINGNVTEPQLCTRCQGTRTFVLVHDKCVFSSKQLMKMQENPESIPEGEAPQTVFVSLYDTYVDCARPGDRVLITGISKAIPVRKNTRVRRLKAVFRTSVDLIHVTASLGGGNAAACQMQEAGDASMQEEIDAGMLPSPQMVYHPTFIARCRALADRPDVYQLLIDSFAPNIWEHTDVKKGLLCQLFGGTCEKVGGNLSASSARVRSRAEIHVLLCGDPSTAKSQLLQYVHRVAPRGVYAVGRGTSAAGLTATVTRDPESRDFVLESGAVVLSDQGICCIDEFDKMDDSTRAILHEVMEQQTVSLAKAGIVCSLNARTAILASANPVNSKYDTRKSVIENINLPSSLLSRFDLIYLILDTANEELDRKLAEHLCGLYTKKDPENETQRKHADKLDIDFMRQYIGYARRVCSPQLSPEATNELVQTYLTLRRDGASGGQCNITATPRQLEALVRLSKALAKMQLKNLISVSHVKEAARLIRAATYQALVDPLTGRIDFEQLHHGLSQAQRARQTLLGSLILHCLEESEESVLRDLMATKVDAMLTEQSQPLAPRREFDKTLQHLEEIRLIARVQGNKYIKSPN